MPGCSKETVVNIINDYLKDLPTRTDFEKLLSKVDYQKITDELEAKLEEKFKNEIKLRDEKIVHLERRLDLLELKHGASEILRSHNSRLIDDNTQYSKKVNIIIKGMPVSKKHGNENIRKMVLDEIDRLRLDIDDLEVDRAHRHGQTYSNKYGKYNQDVICRFTTWSARDVMYQARKRSKFIISADLTRRRQEILEVSREKVSTPDSRANKLIKFVYADRNCLLKVFTIDDRHMSFSSDIEFDNLLNHIEDTQSGDTLAAWKRLSIENALFTNSRIINLSRVDDVPSWIENEENVYIGRVNTRLGLNESKWCNPFSLNDYDIDTCLDKYESHIRNTQSLLDDLPELRHKIFLCYCDVHLGERCHGEVLLKLLD